MRLEITEDDARKWLAENVRTRRKAARLTLKQAAARAEMSWSHWQRVELRQMNATLHTLVRMANVLDTEPSLLLARPTEHHGK